MSIVPESTKNFKLVIIANDLLLQVSSSRRDIYDSSFVIIVSLLSCLV